MAKSNNTISLFICGHCGYDCNDGTRKARKIIFAGYANILCSHCEAELGDAQVDLARKYLTGKDKLQKG